MMMARARAVILGREDSKRMGEVVRGYNQQLRIDGNWEMNGKQQTQTLFKVVTPVREYRKGKYMAKDDASSIVCFKFMEHPCGYSPETIGYVV